MVQALVHQPGRDQSYVNSLCGNKGLRTSGLGVVSWMDTDKLSCTCFCKHVAPGAESMGPVDEFSNAFQAL